MTFEMLSKAQAKSKQKQKWREKKNYTKRLLLNKAVTQHNEQLT